MANSWIHTLAAFTVASLIAALPGCNALEDLDSVTIAEADTGTADTGVADTAPADTGEVEGEGCGPLCTMDGVGLPGIPTIQDAPNCTEACLALNGCDSELDYGEIDVEECEEACEDGINQATLTCLTYFASRLNTPGASCDDLEDCVEPVMTEPGACFRACDTFANCPEVADSSVPFSTPDCFTECMDGELIPEEPSWVGGLECYLVSTQPDMPGPMEDLVCTAKLAACFNEGIETWMILDHLDPYDDCATTCIGLTQCGLYTLDDAGMLDCTEDCYEREESGFTYEPACASALYKTNESPTLDEYCSINTAQCSYCALGCTQALAIDTASSCGLAWASAAECVTACEGEDFPYDPQCLSGLTDSNVCADLDTCPP